MPKHPQLTEIPAPATQRFEDRYPVAQWLDGGVWELKQGKEFKTKPEGFYQTFKEYLKRAGRTDVQVAQRGKSIWVKAGVRTKPVQRRKAAKKKARR